MNLLSKNKHVTRKGLLKSKFQYLKNPSYPNEMHYERLLEIIKYKVYFTLG